jgi:hypothetical protein
MRIPAQRFLKAAPLHGVVLQKKKSGGAGERLATPCAIAMRWLAREDGSTLCASTAALERTICLR